MFLFLQKFSLDGRFLVSADRDFKIRVIVLYHELWQELIEVRVFENGVAFVEGYNVSHKTCEWSSWDSKFLSWPYWVSFHDLILILLQDRGGWSVVVAILSGISLILIHMFIPCAFSSFVSCIAFISNLECSHGFLISGSGDSTVRQSYMNS